MSQVDDLVNLLLEKRGLTEPETIAEFFDPPHPADYSLSQIGLDSDSVSQAISLIAKHQKQNHPIAIYGDYDVDGITATAILWETLHATYPHVFPHIPHRREEGYGLSTKGIDHCLSQGAKLIITVDNGIVAHSELAYAKKAGCDVIVIDHHQSDAKIPSADVLLHSTSTSAAGLTWFFCREYLKIHPSPNLGEGSGVRYLKSQLELVAISVVCDLVPLLGINRSFAKFGLEKLNQTTRPGLLALFASAGIVPPLNTYHLGFVIGPRLNAAGRLEHALDSLRILCTKDQKRAQELAAHLTEVNKTRQDKTKASSDHAISTFSPEALPKLLISASPDYDEGIIGLVAAKLVESYHRPAIAINIGDEFCKGSARSLPGFHITDHLRHFSDLLTAVGGHAMAAGFTIPTTHLAEFTEKTVDLAQKVISDEILIKNQRIDAQIPLDLIDLQLHLQLQRFEPYGLGNPKPVFKSSAISVSGFRRIGADNRHLKFQAGDIEAIYFSAPPGIESNMTSADIVYSLDLNKFNSREALQLVIKNITSSPLLK